MLTTNTCHVKWNSHTERDVTKKKDEMEPDGLYRLLITPLSLHVTRFENFNWNNLHHFKLLCT